MLTTDDLQIQPQIARFLASEKPCNNPGLTKFFSDAHTEEEIAEGQRLCGSCPALTDCNNYVQLMGSQNIPLQGVVAGKYWDALADWKQSEKTGTKKDRTRICERCGKTYQGLRQKPKQRYCSQACRQNRKDIL